MNTDRYKNWITKVNCGIKFTLFYFTFLTSREWHVVEMEKNSWASKKNGRPNLNQNEVKRCGVY
jgi:hypothetical protein